MPQYDYLLLLDNSHKAGANGNTYSQSEINFGLTYPGVAKGGKFGAHVVITQAYTAMNSGLRLDILTGASSGSTTKVSSRTLTQTQLKVLGAHYFIPCAPQELLQYARLKHVPVSENGTLGKMTTWFGPGGDGAI